VFSKLDGLTLLPAPRSMRRSCRSSAPYGHRGRHVAARFPEPPAGGSRVQPEVRGNLFQIQGCGTAADRFVGTGKTALAWRRTPRL